MSPGGVVLFSNFNLSVTCLEIKNILKRSRLDHIADVGVLLKIFLNLSGPYHDTVIKVADN
jgi:hypothetical protein